MKTLGSIWPKRSSTPRDPKSGEQDDQTAPMRGRGQHAHDGLRHVGQHGRDAVAFADAERAQRLLGAAHLGVKLVPGEAPRDEALAKEDDGVAVAGAPQEVLGEVQAGVGEEARAGHAVAVDEKARALLADHAARVPDLVPERVRLGDAGRVQRVEALDVAPETCGEAAREGGHVAGRQERLGGRPQRHVGHGVSPVVGDVHQELAKGQRWPGHRPAER